MSYLGKYPLNMYQRRNSLERTLLGPSFAKLERCSPMAEIDLEFPLPFSIRSRSSCGWGIKGYIIDTRRYRFEILNHPFYRLFVVGSCNILLWAWFTKIYLFSSPCDTGDTAHSYYRRGYFSVVSDSIKMSITKRHTYIYPYVCILY